MISNDKIVISPRTRGIGGVIWGSVQSLIGGEVTAFTSEVEKARVEAIQRAIEQAERKGANAIVGMDIETSEMGSEAMHIMMMTATGTAVVVEPE